MADSPKAPARRIALVLAVALAAYLGGVAIFPRAAAMSLLSDDAYYYVKIAHAIAHGHGSTFDGIARTNGYHPLWMLCMVAVQGVSGSDPVSSLRILMMLCGVLTAGTLFLVHRIVDRFVAPGLGYLAVAACTIPTVITALTNGLETGPLLFALAVLVWAWYRWSLGDPEAGPARRLALGLLLGIVFLCRLDSIFIAVVAIGLNAVVLLARGTPLRRAIGRVATVCLGFAVPAAGFFGWNLGSFHHLTPISGAVKTSFPTVRHPLDLQGDLLFGLALLAVLTLVVAVALAMERRSGKPLRSILGDPIPALWGGCLLHYVHAFLFLGWGVYWWHMAPYGLTLALALPAAAGIVRPPRLRAVLAGVLAVSVVVLGLLVQLERVVVTGQRHGVWLQAAEWARDHSAPRDVFALKDAGLFGYFSERSVVNLDGKANGYEYRECLLRGDVTAYLRRVGTRYLADTHARYDDDRVRIGLPRANLPPVRLTAIRDWEVYHSPPIPSRPFQAANRAGASFRIWRLPEAWDAGGREGETTPDPVR